MSQLARRPLTGLRIIIAMALLASFVVAAPSTAAAEPNDTVSSSVEPTSTPFAASVEATGDVRDVYRFDLDEGQSLSIDVAQTSEATASVALYGPGTTDPVDLSSAIISATLDATGTNTFSERITAHPGMAGPYYLDIGAQSGDSTLTVDWSVGTPSFSLDTTSAAQSVIKGQPATDVTFSANWGELGSDEVTFTAATDQPWLAATPATGTATSGASQSFTLALDPSALTPGVHEATATVVVAGAGPKPFRVSLHVLDKPTITGSTSVTSVKYGGVVTVKGWLRTSTGARPGRQQMVLQRAYPGSAWTTITAPFSDTGDFSVNTAVYRHSYFRWVFAGAGDLAPAAPSAKKLVYSYAYVARPSIPKRIRPNRTYTFSGQLRPQHANNTAAIRLYWEYYSRGKWRRQSSMLVNVSNTSASNAYSVYKYRDRYGKGVTRRWRVRAMHSDTSHVKTYSAWEYYKVY